MTNDSIPSPRKKIAGVYIITCLPNGRQYVGSSVNVQGRLRAHLHSLRGGKHYNSHLLRAWNKYGESSFRFEIAEVVDNALSLIEREQHWIDKLDAVRHGFNVRPQAQSNRGRVLSDEHKKKISESHRGLPRSKEHCRNLSIALTGKTHSEETRRKIGDVQRGQKRGPRTEEDKRKISEAHRGKKRTPMSEEQKRKISEALKGRVKSDDTRRKLSESQRGKKYSEESRRKMSESHRGKTPSEETREKLSAALRIRHRKAKEQKQDV